MLSRESLLISKVGILFVWERLFCEIGCIRVLGLKESVRLVIVFLTKISGLICEHRLKHPNNPILRLSHIMFDY